MLQELINALLRSLSALKPHNLPFGGPLSFLGDELTQIRLVNPFKLANQDQWIFFCTVSGL
jgi:hypothetical protein